MVQKCLKGGTSKVHSYDQSLAMYLRTFSLSDLVAFTTAIQSLYFWIYLYSSCIPSIYVFILLLSGEMHP